MRNLLSNKPLVIGVGVIGTAIVAFLAFGVFGIQTAFIDDEVNEAGPIFRSQGASGLPSDDMTDAEVDDMNAVMVDEAIAAEDETDESEPEMPEVTREVEGEFIDRIHSGTGTAVVLTDGVQRFLRFEDDFAIDNGPDLNVYLSAGVPADGDAGLFDDDFIDLGDLKGNIGPQNYELPADVDLERYSTVVIWCVRFGVAFNAADLA
ncbi:MAG: DM13 domain-containing protein [Acidimicrobiales bacterium]